MNEGGREQEYGSLSMISSSIEGIDFETGEYRVYDELGNEYIAEWITKPTKRKGLLFGIVTIGEYRLVRKS